MPALATWAAMPLPMTPEPRTATFRMRLIDVCSLRALTRSCRGAPYAIDSIINKGEAGAAFVPPGDAPVEAAGRDEVSEVSAKGPSTGERGSRAGCSSDGPSIGRSVLAASGQRRGEG